MSRLEVIEASNAKQISDCLKIREEVFINEQGVPEEEELDDLDNLSFHAIAYLDSVPLATGRLINISTDNMTIGRMAVLKKYRKSGYGKKVLRFLELHAERIGAKLITLHAQLHAKDFYINSGYKEKGNIFLEANIPHIEMYKILWVLFFFPTKFPTAP